MGQRSGRAFAIALAAVPAVSVLLFGAVEPEHALPLEAVTLAAGAIVVVARARRGARPLPLSAVTLPIVLLCLLPSCQLLPIPAGSGAWIAPGLRRFDIDHLSMISVLPSATFLAALRWAAYAAFWIAALEVLRGRTAIRAALGVLAALGVGEALYGIQSLLTGNEHLLWLPRRHYLGDATGTLVNRNHFASLMTLCLPVLLAHRWLAPARGDDGEQQARTILYVLGAAAMGVATILSHSRAGTACLAVALVIVALAARRTGRGRVVGAVAAAIVVYGLVAGVGPLVDRFGDLDRGDTRPGLWRAAITITADFPLLGAGAGTFEGVLPAYRAHIDDSSPYAHAHQDYLELAAEVGLVGLALAVWAAWAYVRAVREGMRRTTPAVRLAAGALVGSLAGVTLHAALDFPLHIPGLVLALLLVAASLVRLVEAHVPNSA